MFDCSGENGDTSGKGQGILIPCVSGNLVQFRKFFCQFLFGDANREYKSSIILPLTLHRS